MSTQVKLTLSLPGSAGKSENTPYTFPLLLTPNCSTPSLRSQNWNRKTVTDQPRLSNKQNSAPQEETIGLAFKNVLNSHGYPFQESVIRTISQVRSSWVLDTLGIRVSSAGSWASHANRSTFLTNRTNTIYLVCECKRVNPAISIGVLRDPPPSQSGSQSNIWHEAWQRNKVKVEQLVGE